MAVDLASKMSAYVVLDEDIVTQGDSWARGTKTRDEFVTELTLAVQDLKPAVVLVEDVPHGITRLIMVKSVIRLQGAIEYAYGPHRRSKILWVPPTTWKAHYKLNGVDTAKLIEPKALELFGYEPPIDLADYKGKLTAARKVRTDYAAAFLMAKWAQKTKADTGQYEVKTTQRSEY
jgi:hypothetical protein